MDLGIFNPGGKQESVCLQCPAGTAGDGRECRGKTGGNFIHTYIHTLLELPKMGFSVQ